jgi:hypothetical protein
VGTGLAFSFEVAVMAGLTDAGQLNDLHVGVPSSSVQVQNQTQMPLIVTVGPDQWTLTAQQSSTIPLPRNGAGIGYSLTNDFATEQFGLVTVVWLLDRQLAPQPDGPLTATPL